jgi:phosphoribosyl 1,2-cyclic phosphodiesterase
MRVRFWGVRGSVPWSTDQSVGYGSNTSCLEIRDEASDRLLILDAGTGIVGVSEALGRVPRAVPILLSHYHWDHVHGLPFFAPFFQSGWDLTIAGPRLPGVEASWASALFAPPYFPVPFAQLASRPAISFVDAAAFTIGAFDVSALGLNHPGGSFAYRIHGIAGDLVYATDHEFGNDEVDESLAAFALNASAVVLDAHYTPDELPACTGRGHASWRQCARFASACGAGHLWLFHHHPGRTDQELADIEASARRVFPATSVAREGVSFTL